jgi:hypothetical protein
VDDRITRTSLHYWTDPRDEHGNVTQKPRVWWPRFDPDEISENTFNICDSAGYYWISKDIARVVSNINRVADRGINQQSVARVSVLVNGGGYGFAERQAYAAYIKRCLSDESETTSKINFSASYNGKIYQISVDFTPQRPR